MFAPRWLVSGFFLAPLALAAVGCQRSEPSAVQDIPQSAASSGPSGPVTLQFELPGGVQTTVIDGVSENTTLAEVMQRIDKPSIQMSGAGEMAFVDAIGDVATDARQGWTFTVDDQFALQGVGTTKLHPPTTIRWKYGEFEMDTDNSDP